MGPDDGGVGTEPRDPRGVPGSGGAEHTRSVCKTGVVTSVAHVVPPPPCERVCDLGGTRVGSDHERPGDVGILSRTQRRWDQ